MIQTAAIIWAVLATGLGMVACMGWIRLAAYTVDVESALRDIQQQRSETTRRGNYTRAAKRKAAITAKAEQIRKEIGR